MLPMIIGGNLVDLQLGEVSEEVFRLGHFKGIHLEVAVDIRENNGKDIQNIKVLRWLTQAS
jgi:hypothetical protein